MNNTIPIFFASNDKYVPYLDVALISLIAHTSKNNQYEIIILKSDISEENQEKLKKHAQENVAIRFYDVKDILEPIKNTLPDMFYYSQHTIDSSLKRLSHNMTKQYILTVTLF